MNFTIVINQFAGEKYFPNLDIIDLAIFDYLKDFYPAADKFTDINGIWFWISHKKIIDDMPKLKIKSKAGIIKRINNLIDCQIIERHPNSKNLGKSYYKVGVKWNLLIKVDTSQPESTGTNNESQQPPNNENQDNYNTIEDSNTIDSLLWKTDFNIYKKELREAYNNLISNHDFLTEQQKFHPNLNIKLTLEKACVNYWSTEIGWNNKKKKKIKTIDWKLTLTNALSSNMNKVYLDKSQMNSVQSVKYNSLENYNAKK